MREFDLASDADLLFVVPDAAASELGFWTGVAERMIHTISAYTAEALCSPWTPACGPNGPRGRAGADRELLQNLLLQNAEAWEGIAYMKSRAVAGDVERATEFLHELQVVDWRRFYGQSGRSRNTTGGDARPPGEGAGLRNPLRPAWAPTTISISP